MEKIDLAERIEEHLLASEIVYPGNILSSGLNYRHKPVFGALYSYYLTQGGILSVEDCAEYLLDLYQMHPLRHGLPDEVSWVLTQTHKLVMDFFQRLHLIALLENTFGPFISHETLEDKGFNVDFLLGIGPHTPGLQYAKEIQIGICTGMFLSEKIRGDWVTRKKDSKQKFGYPAWHGMVFSLSNRHIPHARIVKDLPLFGEDHVSNLLSEVQEYYAPHQYALLE